MKTDVLRSRLDRGLMIDLLRCQRDWRCGDAAAAGSLRSFLLDPNSLDHMLVGLGFKSGVAFASVAPTEKATGVLVVASDTG